VPIVTHAYHHFLAPPGQPPAAPTAVTSITKDAGATVSFLPGAQGDAAVTSWVVTPAIGGTPQAPQTVAAGSATTITGSTGSTYTQVPVTGLANGTAYTFTVHGVSSVGAGAESAPSGANTPLSGLVFGDDFNGPASGPIDPEWWIYTRCGYLAQSEVQYYLPDYCVLDGAGNLKITAEHTSYTGPKYASAGGGSITQPWRAGACQSNTRLYYPSAGNTMTFEAKFQVNPNAGSGFWPGFFWLEGQTYIQAWKTDPLQEGWDSTGKAEIDVAEWYLSGNANSYGNVSWAGSNQQTNINASGLATSQHIYQALWKPGASVVFKRDGSVTATHTSQVPSSGAQFFLMLYMQMLAGGSTGTESIYTDYVRVYDQNLG
jgi:Fibronectin type III domain